MPSSSIVTFAEELDSVLPPDIPHRNSLLDHSARHLEMILEANRQFNLTRITSARDAAVKHVLDSLLPWRRFAEAREVLDAGTGAGFPGIPLAIVLPAVRFTLAESVGKKARFVADVQRQFNLPNVEAVNARAEDMLRHQRFELITGRALAPVVRACQLFAPAVKAGSRVLLYKGPDAASEIEEAQSDARKLALTLRLLERYELPDSMGARTLVEIRRAG